MKNNDLEKYIAELSPELQEKARQCKNKDELNKLIAENDVELSEDALAAVAGGGSCASVYSTGHPCTDLKCPECRSGVYYWDRTYVGNRYYCNNSACIACKENWLLRERDEGGCLERCK